MKAKYLISAWCMSAMALISCTDLNETLYDKLTLDDFKGDKSSVLAESFVNSAYATLRGYGAGTDEGNGVNCYPTCEYVFFTSECASDEACIPTRGSDWYDGGRYQQLQFHTWDAQNDGVTAVWRYNFVGVSKINAVLSQVDQTNIPADAKASAEAELRGLRAYYYYNCSIISAMCPL